MFNGKECPWHHFQVQTKSQVKINDNNERRFGVVMTPFSSSKMKRINCHGVMTTPKRRSLLSFIFTCLCISKPLLINEKSPGILIICRKGSRHQIFAFFIMFVLFSNSENLLSCQKKASYLFEEMLRQNYL